MLTIKDKCFYKIIITIILNNILEQLKLNMAIIAIH